MKFVCKDCGYTCEGDSAPDECPCCHKKGVFKVKSKYEGTKTEKNLQVSLVSLRLVTSTLTSHLLLRKQVMSRLLQSSYTLQTTRKSTLRCGLKSLAA